MADDFLHLGFADVQVAPVELLGRQAGGQLDENIRFRSALDRPALDEAMQALEYEQDWDRAASSPAAACWAGGASTRPARRETARGAVENGTVRFEGRLRTANSDVPTGLCEPNPAGISV